MSVNAHSLVERPLRWTPGWAVGFYFVPVVNLWRPYQALSEINDLFHERAGRSPKGWLLPSWWTLFIVSGVIGRIVFRLSLSAETIDQFATLSTLMVVADSVDIGLDLLAFLVVANVSAAGGEAERLRSEAVPPPLPTSGPGGNPFLQNMER